MQSLGQQILADLYQCAESLLSDVDFVSNSMIEAARVSNCTIVSHTFHHFSPYGVSGAVIISESHLAIHTWPEFQFAAVDIFTCGDTIDPVIALNHLKMVFKSEHISTMEMKRGQVDFIGIAPELLRVKKY